MSRRHDQSYKLLFSLPTVIRQMIRHIDPDLAEELDFDRMENLATERITPGLVRSHADLMWKVHYRGESRYLLVPIEFQSELDHWMAVRIHHYIWAAYYGMVPTRSRRRRRPAHEELLPETLAVTVYNGRDRWTATDDVFDLIKPGSARHRTVGYQARLRHRVLDLREMARHSLPEAADVVSWIASMELDSSARNVSRVVGRVLDEYPGPEHKRLREAFRDWVLGAAESWGIAEETLQQVKSLKEAGMIYAGVEELKERIEELKERGRREGRREGRAEGSTAVVCRLARLKFGAQTAERLSTVLEGITDPERIARIGDRVIECGTGAELLERACET